MTKFFKYLCIPLICILILCLPRFLENLEHGDQSKSDAYVSLIDMYSAIKTKEQSELKPLLIEIIDKRLQCYSEKADFRMRLKNCRKTYMHQVLRTAREEIKSAPSLGEFMLCIINCPFVFSMCKGEENGSHENVDCRDIECLCIEDCLDRFWSGNNLE